MLRSSFLSEFRPLVRLKLSVRPETSYQIAEVMFWRLARALYAFCAVPCESDSPEITHEMAFLQSQSTFLTIAEAVDNEWQFDFHYQLRNMRKVGI